MLVSKIILEVKLIFACLLWVKIQYKCVYVALVFNTLVQYNWERPRKSQFTTAPQPNMSHP
uniref:Uncharacterized protein n=1 Tax=Anguilla anguilla TaxID=7936 RepID=A0A0E9XKM4_ANGAN